MTMKKKETFWELITRLDEESAQFNLHLSEANRYFDTAAKKSKQILEKEQQQLHRTISKVRAAIEGLGKKKKRSEDEAWRMRDGRWEMRVFEFNSFDGFK